MSETKNNKQPKTTNNMNTKLIENQECFAIVQIEENTYVTIGPNVLAQAQSIEHAREMIATKDWRLIVGVASLIANGAIEDYKQFKTNEQNETTDKTDAN